MKIAITSSGDRITSLFDKRFGRAAWFCLLNKKTGEVTFHKNEDSNTSNGAGIKAAEKMVELEVKRVVSGDFGPKAKDLLEKFNIQMVIISDENITIEKIVNRIIISN